MRNKLMMDKLKWFLNVLFFAANGSLLHHQPVLLFALRVFPTSAWTGSFLVEPTSQGSRSSTQTAPSSSSSSSAGSAWMKENFQKPKTLHWRSVRQIMTMLQFILFNIFKDPFPHLPLFTSFKLGTLAKPEKICQSESFHSDIVKITCPLLILE